MHRDYFRLRKPLERRMYELARKHCGKQDEWVDFAGAAQEEMRLRVRGLRVSAAGKRHLRGGCQPQPHARLRHFVRRQQREVHEPQNHEAPPSSEHSYVSAARPRNLSRRADGRARLRHVYLEQEWRNFWVEAGRPELKSPDAAFIGFCKSRYTRESRIRRT